MTASETQHYSDSFYESISTDSSVASGLIVPFIANLFNPKSVADFGCGNGIWLASWQKVGINAFAGFDGHYVDKSTLKIDSGKFFPSDLTKPIELAQKFDLAMSLEVAEHIDPTKENVFLENLTKASDVILFSAAPPGQGGVDHINEKSYGYWKAKFENLGYIMIDIVRPHFIQNKSVAPWYKYNMFVYIKESSLSNLNNDLKKYIIPKGESVKDLSSFPWKFRKIVLSILPRGLVTQMARAKHFIKANKI